MCFLDLSDLNELFINKIIGYVYMVNIMNLKFKNIGYFKNINLKCNNKH